MSKQSIKDDVELILDDCNLLDGMKELELRDLQFFKDENGLRVWSGYGNYGGEILRRHPIAQDYLYGTLESTSETVLQVIDELFHLYPDELGEIVIKPDGEVHVHGTE
jgi:hypothetical protein